MIVAFDAAKSVVVPRVVVWYVVARPLREGTRLDVVGLRAAGCEAIVKSRLEHVPLAVTVALEMSTGDCDRLLRPPSRRS